jgi:predicted DNA-binding protein (UPF0251 family)
MNVMLKNSRDNATNATAFPTTGQCGQTRVFVVLTVGLALGLTVGALWFRRVSPSQPVVVSESSMSAGLSQPTIELLQHLSDPVEVRFYAVLRNHEGNTEPKAFVGRIGAMLSEYEQAGGGKIQIKHFDAGTRGDATAAAADGVEPIQLRQSDAEYLGLAVVGNGQKVVLPRLSPEWEAALEFDLSRAIARVSGSPSVGELVVNPAPRDVATAQELLQTIPEIESLSLADATLQVRANSLEEFKVAVSEMQSQLQSAQQRVAEAQREGPAAEAAARKRLQQLQIDQNARLGEIARRLQSRLDALQQLKRSQP